MVLRAWPVATDGTTVRNLDIIDEVARSRKQQAIQRDERTPTSDGEENYGRRGKIMLCLPKYPRSSQIGAPTYRGRAGAARGWRPAPL